MGALINVFKSGMTRKHVPESGDTRLATRSMESSANALTVVAKGNQQGSQALRLAVHTIGQKRTTQATTDQLGKQLGLIEGWADQQVQANMAIAAAAAHYTRGTKAMNSSAKILAKTSQTTAVDSATTQYDMYRDHTKASMQVTMKQSAYGGAGWSA